MLSGVTLARRFTLMNQEDYDLDGATRWRARDDRLRKDVTAFTLTDANASRVLSAIARVSSVRDPRLARIVASGTDTVDDAPVPYVIADRPGGTVLADVLKRRDLPPRLAGAIIGSLSRALVPLSGRDIHHGAIRAEAITVTDAGVPVLSGLGLDAQLLSAPEGDDAAAPSESGDARALAEAYVRCLTGRDTKDLDVEELPADLTGPARGLSVSLLRGDGPSSLSEVVAAFPPDHSALRDFSSSVRALPLRAEVARAELHATVGKTATEVVGPLTLVRAARTAEIAYALTRSAPDLHTDVSSGTLAGVAAALPPSRPAAAEDSAVPEDERALFDDLEAYDEMVEAQNSEPSRSWWEAILFHLHRRWPQSPTLARLHDEAHERAGRAGPIPTRALLMTAGVALVAFAFITALSLLAAPVQVDQDRHNPPEHTYPSYTFDPTASPSAEQ